MDSLAVMFIAAGLMRLQRIKYRLPRRLPPRTNQDERPVAIQRPGLARVQG